MLVIPRIPIITNPIISLKNLFFLMVLLACYYINPSQNFIKTRFGSINCSCHFLMMTLFPNLTRCLPENSYRPLIRKILHLCQSLFLAARFIKFNRLL